MSLLLFGFASGVLPSPFGRSAEDEGVAGCDSSPLPNPLSEGEGAKTSTSSTSPGHHGLSNYTSNQGKFTLTVLYLFSEILSPAYTIKMSSLTVGLPTR